LSTSPPPNFAHLPIKHALVLDPWLEPLPTPGPFPIAPDAVSINGSLNQPTPVSSTDPDGMWSEPQADLPRILVINSERFTLWKDHFERLQDIIQRWDPDGQRIITLSQSSTALKHLTRCLNYLDSWLPACIIFGLTYHTPHG
jgi:platelet-activating factor acetylhydrolase